MLYCDKSRMVDNVPCDVIEESAVMPIEDRISRYYSPSDIKDLISWWESTHDVESSMYHICEIPLRKLNETSINRLASSKSMEELTRYHDVEIAILNVASMVIVDVKKGKVLHEKGDFVEDRKGNVKMVEVRKEDGSVDKKVPETYKEEVRSPDVIVPLFPLSSPRSQKELKTYVHNVVVPYRFEELRKKYSGKQDAKRARELVKVLFSKYWPIGLDDAMLDRIMVWFCNAKGKGVGMHPAYGCILAMVGSMAAGKSYLADMLAETYASCFDTQVRGSVEWGALFDQFNAVWETRGLLCLNEVCAASKADREVFKNRITARKITINQKHIKQYEVENWTTIFSATNDEVLPMLGLQENRRIIQVRLRDRTKANWLGDDELRLMLTEIWEVMPFSYDEAYAKKEKVEIDGKVVEVVMDAADVFSTMLKESDRRIGEELWDIVSCVFIRKMEFLRRVGGRETDIVQIASLKKVLREESGYTSWADFVGWLKKKGILWVEDNGSYRCHFDSDAYDKVKTEIEGGGYDDIKADDVFGTVCQFKGDGNKVEKTSVEDEIDSLFDKVIER